MINQNKYDQLRDKYRPEKIELLLLAEAPPNPPPCRFFYCEKFVRPDSLYKETMSVIFYLIQGHSGARPSYITACIEQHKEIYLKCFQMNGIWLLDAVPDPLGGRNPRQAIQANIGRILGIIKNITQKQKTLKCVLIKNIVYQMLAQPLQTSGVNVLNKQALPFPSNGQQARFRKEFGELLINNGYMLPMQCALLKNC